MKLSPKAKGWARNIVIAIIFIITLRYLLWRSLSTLNLSSLLNGIFSVGLFLMEIAVISSFILQLYLLLKVKPRYRQADVMSAAVISGNYQPTVDILIPTYNEPVTILRRTVIGCQALDYPHKIIYILDDSKRQEVRMLAQKLGCKYIARTDNRYAKAGNLNHALGKTFSELITVFDADFIPTKNFLTRTVGFFQDQTIALLQTHQSFYNSDPIARNLGLEDKLTHEVESFSRYYQLLRDSIETALCYGSSFIVRRSALEEVGGFVTDTLSEDYFTGVLLSACGYRVIYLGESLSAGLSAENMASHIQQRLRWARGTLQGFFVATNPLKVNGLKPLQRLAHLEGMTQWFTSLFRAIFLLIPLTYTFFNIVPFHTTVAAWLYFFLPFYCLQLSTYSWLNFRSRSALMSDVYSLSQCFPISLTIVQTLLSPFSEKFRVTPKGTTSVKYKYNWTLAFPLIVIFVLTAISFIRGLNLLIDADTYSHLDLETLGSQRLAWIWSGYNLLMLTVSLRVMLDAPKPSIAEWFDMKKTIELTDKTNVAYGVTKQLSEVGAKIETKTPLTLNSRIEVNFLEEGLRVKGKIEALDFSSKNPTAIIKFEQVNLPQYRKIIEMLFCQPGRWPAQETPGELQALWLLFKALFQPLFPKKLL
jgi:cellulose synthase (UDP-forming)